MNFCPSFRLQALRKAPSVVRFRILGFATIPAAMKWQPSDSLRQWSFVPHQNSRRGPGICRHRAGREQALPVAAKSLDLAAMTNRFERGNPASPPLCPAMSYQPAVILTYEDGFWRFSAQSFTRGGSVRSDDVVHRYEGATMSEGRQKPPAGLSDPPAGQRRMNHIAASAASCQRTDLTILIGQDHHRLVSCLRR